MGVTTPALDRSPVPCYAITRALNLVDIIFCTGRSSVNQRLADPISRRGFLRAGAVATMGIAGIPSSLLDHDKQPDPLGGFKLGIQSYTFRHFTTEQALKRTQDLGLHYIEFYRDHANPNSSPEQIDALRHLCAAYEITPIAFGVERFSKNHDSNRKLFEFGKALGIRSLSADPDPDSFD